MIKLIAVTKVYDNNILDLKNVNLTIENGIIIRDEIRGDLRL